MKIDSKGEPGPVVGSKETGKTKDDDVPMKESKVSVRANKRTLEQEKSVQKYLDGIPKRRNGIVSKAFAGKSMKSAITAKCLDCVGYEDIAENIGKCRAVTCPLWLYRPAYKTEKE